MPSIASVSDMELLTRVESEEAGSRVRLQAGELMKREAVGRPTGHHCAGDPPLPKHPS